MADLFVLIGALAQAARTAGGREVNNVEVIEDSGGLNHNQRHFRVKVNGKLLYDRRGRDRRWSSSIDAAVAGAKEVDRQRSASSALPEQK